MSSLHRNFPALIALVLSCLICASAQAEDAPPLPEGVFTYKESVGEKTTFFTWEAEQPDSSDVLIKVIDGEKKYRNLCDIDGATTEWEIHQGEEHNITATREGNFIHMKGVKFGKVFDEKVPIDERPWYQPLSYCLGKFIESGKDTTSFWIIRIDTMELIPLTVKRMGEEHITIEGKEIAAEKLEVRAEGYKAKFWHATYWFRQDNRFFVRYQSVHGLPGTAMTIIELVQSPRQGKENNLGQHATTNQQKTDQILSRSNSKETVAEVTVDFPKA